MTSIPHGLYAQGYTRATMGGTKSSELGRASESQKAILSADGSLQRDFMMPEALGIADQQAAVKTFPGGVHTARHTRRIDRTGGRWANLFSGGGRRRRCDW